MSDTDNPQYYNQRQTEQFFPQAQPLSRKKTGIWLNIVLFIATVITTIMAGIAWLNRDPFDLNNFSLGVTYSILIITFLTFHEFGHYFAARIHKVDVTLPFYIPFPLVLNPFGTMGAVIRMRQPILSRKALFDIGIAGPVAGFVVSVAFLVYGMTHLPPFEYIYNIHPEYAISGVPTSGFAFGPNLLYIGLAKLLTGSPDVFMPPMNEMYHYPFLCVGWFGLLVTGLNLLPVGQLDGGHIIYALFKSKSKYIARGFFTVILILGLIGAPTLIDMLLLSFFDFRIFNITWLDNYSFYNWLIWAVLIFFVIKIEHPPFVDHQPVGLARQIWGVFALFMFITTFTPVPVMNI